MNRLLLVAPVAALMLLTIGAVQTPAQSTVNQPTVHAPTVKIGWMNVEQAIMTCDEGVKTVNDLQKLVDAKNTERDVMMRELEDLRARLEVQASKLTDEALANLEEEARAKEVTLQRFVDDTQKDLDARRQRMIRTISARMGPVIEKVAIEKGLDAVHIFDPQRDAWVNPGLNVTDDIIKAYNQAYPAGAPTMPPAAKRP